MEAGTQLVDGAEEGKPMGVTPAPNGAGVHLQKGRALGLRGWGIRGRDALRSSFRKSKALLKTF